MVKPSYGLSDSEIETMLRDSFTHAREDEQARKLREQQVDADRLLESVSSALAVDGALLSDGERSAIDQAMAELKVARTMSEAGLIKRAMEALDRTTQAFAQRRMDTNIRKALAGHRLDEFNTPSESKPPS